jgi:phenylacetic acid degradation operon negative regulatory protein
MARYVVGMAHAESSSRDVEQPRALIVTIYGLYARDSAQGSRNAARDSVQGSGYKARDSAQSLGHEARDSAHGSGHAALGPADVAGWLPVSALVRMLAELDVDEPAVRSAISRLKRRGLLEAHRRDGTAGYALSEGARAILEEGDARIFAPPTPRLADGWLLAVFSVPETERAKRHTLRSQLGALGFGAVAPGVWVAPAHRFELTAATLQRHGLAAYVDLFRAEYLAFGDIEKHARDWWDLAGLRTDYESFLATYRPVLAAAPVTAFADWVRALTAWRRLPYRDPGLPVELLPEDWPGDDARELLAELRVRLAGPAEDHVLRLLGPGPRRAG